MPGTDQYVGKAAYGYNSCPDSGALQKCTSCWPEDGVVSISLESTRLEKSEQSKKKKKKDLNRSPHFQYQKKLRKIGKDRFITEQGNGKDNRICDVLGFIDLRQGSRFA